MTDIATLSYSVDSSGLQAAERALDSQTQAAERTSQAAEQLGDRYREVARRGVEFAESMRHSNESERSLAERAREAAAGLDVKAQATRTAAQELQVMRERVEAIQAAEEREARVAAESARAKAAQEINLRKLLGQIDPTIAKLEQLGQMEGNLERALDAGAITPEIFDHYAGKIDATRAATLNMGKAQDIATNSIGKLNLNTVEAQQSMAALARSMATGQWGMATSSITSLTARTGAMSAAFSATGLAIGGVSAAIGFVALQAGKGYFEARKLEGVIIALGSATGSTTGQLLDLRNEIGRATGDYAGATQAINQLVLSGKLTGDMLESVARSATGLAQMTGQSVGTVASEIERLADGGSEALVKLNERYNFLTLATYEQIEAIREERGDAAALQRALSELEKAQASRASQMEESAGWVERAWRAVKLEVRETLQAIKDVGRADAERRLQQASRQMENMRRGAGMSDPETYAPYVMAREEAKRALEAVMELDAKESERARKRAADNKAIADRDAAAREAEKASEFIDRQRQAMYGLNTAVNELETNFAKLNETEQQALITSGQYAELMARAIETDRKRNETRKRVAKERESDEARAARRLKEQYEASEASLIRSIALHGQVGRAAAMAYDTAHGALKAYTDEQKATLMELSSWLDFLEEQSALEGVWDDVRQEHAKYRKDTESEYEFMTEYARQAARNMQSHFADFLFDPFADRTKSMGEAFSEVLRRMMAEAAASKMFEVLGGAMSAYSGSGSGWINMLGGMMTQQSSGRREHGGPVSGQGLYRVGERNKPELLNTPNGQYLIPGEQGSVVPMGHNSAAARTPQININVMGNAEVESATARQNSSGGFDVDVILKQMIGAVAGDVASGGPVWQAVKGRGGFRDAV